MSAKKNFVHVEFDQMQCPVAGCTSLKGGPQKGSVPGVKRHVKLVHGEDVYNKLNFPALRTATGPISGMTKTVLLEAAVSRNLADKDGKYTKEQLVNALTSGTTLVKAPKASKAEKDVA